MDGRQHIYYALGILVYGMAKADGAVQEEERKQLFEIVKRETEHNIDFQYAEIIFQLLERDQAGFEGIYKWALSELNTGRHYLSPEIKEKMVATVRRIAEAFDAVTREEESFLDRFKKDLDHLGVDHYIK